MIPNDTLHQLDQSVNIPGFFTTYIQFVQGHIQLFLHRRHHVAKCSSCGQYCGTFYDSKMRSFRDFDWGERPVFIRVQRVRVNCPRCGIVVEKLPFASLWSPTTERFAAYLVDLCVHMTCASVAHLYGFSEGTIGRIEEEVLKRRYRRVKRHQDLHILRVDEIAIRKGHNYMTVFVNHETGQVVEAIVGRKVEDLAPFFQSLGTKKCSQIKAISMDMGRSYIAAAERWCPQARIVFDRFHVVKQLVQALEKVRKRFVGKCKRKERESMNETSRVLGKNPENLTEKQAQVLAWVKKEKSDLFTVYEYKEEFRKLWEYPTKRGAEIFLTRWLKKVRALEHKELNDFCGMVERHREGIMNYYFYPLTNGPQEGFNNKLNVIRRRAYGFRNMGRFALKIYQAADSK